jgi:hypothetical protein
MYLRTTSGRIRGILGPRNFRRLRLNTTASEAIDFRVPQFGTRASQVQIREANLKAAAEGHRLRTRLDETLRSDPSHSRAGARS